MTATTRAVELAEIAAAAAADKLASDIIALRTQHASGRWDELWPAHATHGDPLRPAI